MYASMTYQKTKTFHADVQLVHSWIDCCVWPSQSWLLMLKAALALGKNNSHILAGRTGVSRRERVMQGEVLAKGAEVSQDCCPFH